MIVPSGWQTTMASAAFWTERGEALLPHEEGVLGLAAPGDVGQGAGGAERFTVGTAEDPGVDLHVPDAAVGGQVAGFEPAAVVGAVHHVQELLEVGLTVVGVDVFQEGTPQRLGDGVAEETRSRPGSGGSSGPRDRPRR